MLDTIHKNNENTLFIYDGSHTKMYDYSVSLDF